MLILVAGMIPALAQAPSAIETLLAIEDPVSRVAALRALISGAKPSEMVEAREGLAASLAQVAEKNLAANDIEKAAAGFRAAIAEFPMKLSDRFFMTTAIRIPQATSMRGYRSEAIDLARLLESRVADDALKLAAIGEYYMTIEAPGDAIRTLEKAARLNDKEPQIHRLLAGAYRLGLRLDEAIAEYQLTIGRNPGDNRAYYELGNLYRAHGALTDAIELYRKQLVIEPRHSPSWKGLSLAELGLGRQVESEAALAKVREISAAGEDPEMDVYLQTQLAFALLAQRRLTPARQAAERALVIEPRYAWARIAAAEVELASGQYFEAERNLLAAQQYAGFPTLFFTLGKLYLAVDDYDGALEQFAKAFRYQPGEQFVTTLGGSREVKSGSLRELLAREHRAAIFLHEPPTDPETFRIAEALTEMDRALRGTSREAVSVATTKFLDATRNRQSIRALYAGQRLLAIQGFATRAIEVAEQALANAEKTIELEGSLRDYPNYDREGRERIIRGRALDLKGWALYKAGREKEAAEVLLEAVRAYGTLPETRRALWHLAMVRESAGNLEQALELYIAGYQPGTGAKDTDVGRTVIELLYTRLHGSREGLEERLRRSADGLPVGLLIALGALPPESAEPPPVPVSPAPATNAGGFERKTGIVIPRPDTGKPAAPSGISLPRTDPMFARSRPAGAPEESKPLKAEPVILPLPPLAMAITDPLTPFFNQQRFFARWDGLRLSAEPEMPPPPVATRKRRVLSVDPETPK